MTYSRDVQDINLIRIMALEELFFRLKPNFFDLQIDVQIQF